METSSDDDGDAAAARLLLIALCLCFSFPPRSEKPAVRQSAPPLSGTNRPAPKEAPRKKHKSSARKKLYLTFDDGPNRGTANVLRIISDEQVPVTFFIVGEHVFDSRGQRALFDSLKASAWVAVCNHSFSHARGRYSNYYEDPEAVVDDFSRTRDTLSLDNTIARTPGRNIWRVDSLKFTDLRASARAADSLQKAGFVLMGWDAEWHFDHKTFNVLQDAGTLLRQIDSVFAKRKTKHPDHLVLLAHDQAFVQSCDSLQLRLFLQELKKRDDLELVLATEYPGIGKTDSLMAWR